MGTKTTKRLAAALALVLALASTGRAGAQAIDPSAIPPALREWVPWVTATEPLYGCTREGEALVCAWPGLLELGVEGNDVRFALSVVTDRARTVLLPGGDREWPVDVREGTRELVVLTGPTGGPVVELGAGAHRVEGRIRFGQRPESLHVPGDVARIVAIVGGVRVPLMRASEGVVPLQAAALAGPGDEVAAETDSVSLEIVRRVADGLPLRIDTQITARVGGRARPIALGRALVAGSVPSAVESTLPIQVSPEGDVVLQAQSGTHRIRIAALIADPDAPLVAPRLAAPWPAQEIWLFAPSEEHRQVDVRGPSSIDPQSPSIPEDWRSSAAYVLRAGETTTLATVRRGEPEPPPNALSIQREMWLDFSGDGFTIRDVLSGEIHRSDRLDLRQGELGRVTIGGIDQLVTLPPGGRGRGVELRTEDVAMQAEWRFRGSPRDVPAVGWSEDARSLAVTLNLPPGYSLFAAGGVDSAPSAWLERWDVGPIFLVLLLGVIVARLFDLRAGLVAVGTLALIFFEPDAPTFLWLFVLVPLAVLRFFQKGVFARIVFVAFALLATSLVVSAGIFVASQLRYAMHPQLLTEDQVGGYVGGGDAFGFGDAAPPPAAEAPSDVEAVVQAVAGESARDSDTNARGRFEGLTRSAGSGGSAPGSNQPDRGYLANWIDPNAVVQTGHGLVDWHHVSAQLAWSGPVDAAHRIHLYLIPPWLQRVLALLRAVGVLFLLGTIARARPAWPSKADEDTPPAAPAAPIAVGAALLLFVGGSTVHAQPAQGMPETPGPTILSELHDRVLAPPECGASCIRYGDGLLVVDGDALRFELIVHASVQAAIPLPGPASSFVPDLVTIDGTATNGLRALDDGHLSLRVPAGVHRVALTASLAGRGSLALSFASVPGRIEARATGWSVSGLDENGNVRGSLELRRAIGVEAPSASARAQGADVPNWVVVERRIDLGVQWLVQTTVRRLASTSAPAIVRLPALEGEAVLGNEATRDGGFVVATLGQGVPELHFTSSIRATGEVRLHADERPVAAADVHRSELWTYACSPLWHCSHEGLVPLHRAVDGAVTPTFAPYPGDSLRIRAQRVAAAPGGSFTFDRAQLTVSPGARARESTLELEIRTSVSNTLHLHLPRGAEVQSVTVDGARRAVQLRNQVLAIGVVPSNRAVSVVFTEPIGLGFTTTTPSIRLGAATVDVTIVVNVPPERWLLATSGPSWGPIVLFWGHLVLVLVIAAVLGRIPKSPLRTYEWALLALGLTQLPLPATLIVAAWFFGVRLQHERKLGGLAWNLAQAGLGLHAFVAACILVSAVWVGLNDRPDMQIVGNGSSSDLLRFYADRSTGTLPSATFVSVSVWAWKGLMLAWAFWLAYSVVRWATWAVSPFREKGFFVSLAPGAPPRAGGAPPMAGGVPPASSGPASSDPASSSAAPDPIPTSDEPTTPNGPSPLDQ